MAELKNDSGKTAGYKLFRKWQWRGLSFRSDLISTDYMRRWVIGTPWFLIRLHCIMRDDADRHFHDHPFSFVSLILRGGYREFVPGVAGPISRVFKFGDIVKKRSTELHYLKLLDGSAWTLVFTTPYHREWGFQTEDGWIHHAEYDAWLAERDAKRDDADVIAITTGSK